MLSECTNNKVFDFDDVADMSEDDAWDHVVMTAKEAAESRELDEFREAIKVYQKAVHDISYEQLELSFRANELGIFIIAMEPREGEILDTHTLVDLSGKKDCKYKVGYFFKKTPRTGKLAEAWPTSEEENLARLKDAGTPYERGIPKCLRCKEMGHTAKTCTEGEGEVEKPSVKCVICESEGHRARDCTQVRVDRFACRNCKQSGHAAADCTEPRSAEGVECKNCNEGTVMLFQPIASLLTPAHAKQLAISPKIAPPAVGAEHVVTAVGHTIKKCPEAEAADAGGNESWGAGAEVDTGAGAAGTGNSEWDNTGTGVEASSSWGAVPAAPVPITSGGGW
ncbi:MAG: hypothetical protein Q9224_005238 [Gallowayella concinna]